MRPALCRNPGEHRVHTAGPSEPTSHGHGVGLLSPALSWQVLRRYTLLPCHVVLLTQLGVPAAPARAA